MSVALLTQAAECLGPLADEVVFLGGASIGLWLSERLRERGFNEDSASGVICRWRHGSGVVLDVMPTDTTVLGFANRWYPDAFDTATRLTLPSGQSVRAASPALMVATKIEAFHGRGDGD